MKKLEDLNIRKFTDTKKYAIGYSKETKTDLISLLPD